MMKYQVSDITDEIFSYAFSYLAELRPIPESLSFIRAVRPMNIIKYMIFFFIKADFYD